MQNNLFTTIVAFVLALALIAAGVVLLVLGKIDVANSFYFFGGALAIFGIHGAFQAPSPAQHAALQQRIVGIEKQLAEMAMAPVPTPTPVVQAPAIFNPVPAVTYSAPFNPT